MKIVTIVGARPQFIKAAPVTQSIRKKHAEVLVHTGQHYDDAMSAVFFKELDIPLPDYNLEVGSGSHGRQTGEMLMRIEKVLEAEKPDYVLVYGDTNSTLAGSLASVKLQIPVAHVEAGLRSFNRAMPEEYNRVLTDHCANILFCPTQTSVENLMREGICNGVHLVGDVMYDAIRLFGSVALEQSKILDELNLGSKDYLLATLHRPYNTDTAERLQQFLDILFEIDEKIVFPAHPRTLQKLSSKQLNRLQQSNVLLINPIGYLDMLKLEQNARMILTDSGGVQKEAFLFSVPCITLRSETEWTETVDYGWNKVTGMDRSKILHALYNEAWPSANNLNAIFGNGYASEKIIDILDDVHKIGSHT